MSLSPETIKLSTSVDSAIFESEPIISSASYPGFSINSTPK